VRLHVTLAAEAGGVVAAARIYIYIYVRIYIYIYIYT